MQPGKTVVVKKLFSSSKGESAYVPTDMTLVDRSGSMVTAESEGRIVARNFSCFIHMTRNFLPSHYPDYKDTPIETTISRVSTPYVYA